MRTGAPLENARMTPAAPTPPPMSAEPEITAWMVSPAPCVPTLSSFKLYFLKMPASWPSVGGWFSQLLIWPMASLSVSSAKAEPDLSANGAARPSATACLLVRRMDNPPSVLFFDGTPGRHSTPGPTRPGSPKLSSFAFGRPARLGGGLGLAPCRRPRRPRQAAGFGNPHAPIFPGAIEAGGLLADPARQLDFAGRKRNRRADGHGTHLILGIARREHRAKHA